MSVYRSEGEYFVRCECGKNVDVTEYTKRCIKRGMEDAAKIADQAYEDCVTCCNCSHLIRDEAGRQ